MSGQRDVPADLVCRPAIDSVLLEAPWRSKYGGGFGRTTLLRPYSGKSGREIATPSLCPLASYNLIMNRTSREFFVDAGGRPNAPAYSEARPLGARFEGPFFRR